MPPQVMAQTVPKVLPTSPLTLTVKALPESGRPADFNGAVGTYDIESILEKDEVEAGNPVTYKVRIRGQGNLNTVQTPPLPKMDDFKVYDSSSSTQISKDRLIVEGEKLTETVIVPRKAGAFIVPAMSFSYFDPRGKIYKTLKTASHTLKVKPSTEAEPSMPPQASALVAPTEREDVSMMAKDIRYIRTVDEGAPLAGGGLLKRPSFWVLNGTLLAGLLLSLLVGALREKDRMDLKGIRFRRSVSAARRRLRTAHGLLKEDKQEAFYAEAAKAVYQYFGDRLNVPSQSVTLEAIEERTVDLEPALYNHIRQLFDELSMGRFAQAQKNKDEMKAVYHSAEKVINAFERVKVK